MSIRVTIEYILAALIVLILGALAGWYFFLHTKTQSTVAVSTARGYGTTIPSGSANTPTNTSGSAPQSQGTQSNDSSAPQTNFVSRIWNSIWGAGTGVSTPAPVPSFGSATTFTSTGDFRTIATSNTGPKRPPQLWQIQNKPVAGMAFVQTGKGTRLRYVERSSGYVFDADPETGDVVRRTNTLMPKIYEALITENGHVIERSLDAVNDITTFAGSIPTTTPTATDSTSTARSLAGLMLSKNITHLSADPRTGALFYLVRGEGGVAGIRSDWNGTKQKRVFQSALTNWRPWLLEDGRTILTQAPLDSMPGYAYELKNDGALTPILEGIPGLAILPRTSGGLLWSQSARGVLSLSVQVTPSATSVQLPIQTIADKCVWSSGKIPVAYCGVPQVLSGGDFLDDWYRGAAHSSDALWRVDASAGSAELVYTPPTGTSLDIENPTMDSGGNYISFTNAADKSLWLLRITK